MENKKSAEEELKMKSEESFQESIIRQEIDKVIEGILKMLDDCSLSPIEILGVLEVIRHTIHEDVNSCICKDCAKELDLKGEEINNKMRFCLNMGESDTCEVKRIKIGKKIYNRVDDSFDDNERCHDCGILNKKGNIHHMGCDMEMCPKCGKQLISCQMFGGCDVREFID